MYRTNFLAIINISIFFINSLNTLKMTHPNKQEPKKPA